MMEEGKYWHDFQLTLEKLEKLESWVGTRQINPFLESTMHLLFLKSTKVVQGAWISQNVELKHCENRHLKPHSQS